MKRVIYFVFVVSFMMSSQALASASCVKAFNRIVSATETQIDQLYAKNSAKFDKAVFDDCVAWVVNRRSYTGQCESSNTPEWQSVLKHLKTKTNPSFSKICKGNKRACKSGCPDVVAHVVDGGLPALSHAFEELYPVQTAALSQ